MTRLQELLTLITFNFFLIYLFVCRFLVLAFVIQLAVLRIYCLLWRFWGLKTHRLILTFGILKLIETWALIRCYFLGNQLVLMLIGTLSLIVLVPLLATRWQKTLLNIINAKVGVPLVGGMPAHLNQIFFELVTQFSDPLALVAESLQWLLQFFYKLMLPILLLIQVLRCQWKIIIFFEVTAAIQITICIRTLHAAII